MYLTVNKGKYIDEGFIRYLIELLQAYIADSVDYAQLLRCDAYLKTNSLIDSFDSTLQIIKESLKSFVWTETEKVFEISIKNDKIVKGKVAKLNEICKLINYGNLEFKGYPIFSDAFGYFENHIPEALQRYLKP